MYLLYSVGVLSSRQGISEQLGIAQPDQPKLITHNPPFPKPRPSAMHKIISIINHYTPLAVKIGTTLLRY
jgi:hypothetical protein